MAGLRRLLFAVLVVGCLPDVACAAGDGASLGLPWVIPFAGILLSIALFPLLAPHFWHHHFGKISLFWSLLFLVPYAVSHSIGGAFEEVLHVYVLEFIPFIILLWALYTVAGGIRLRGRLRGSPLLNTGLLLLGTALASWMGTTGAAMLLIRPLLRANEWRQRKTHLVVFFIFMVANIGGALTPLGDPPLFLGFLHGVSFFWTAEHMLVPMLVSVAVLAVVFFVFDTWILRGEAQRTPPPDESGERLGLEGTPNFLLLGGIIAAILYAGANANSDRYYDASAIAAVKGELTLADTEIAEASLKLKNAGESERPALVKELLSARAHKNAIRSEAEHHAVKGIHLTDHVTLPWINLVRDGLIVLMGVISLLITSRELRRKNDFTWFPIVEVAKLFAGIFVTIIPAIEILKAGTKGALSSVVMAVTDGQGDPINRMYFWFTGGLSSFLDNAPTYLVFFNTAGGDSEVLQGELATTLLAISAGAVFMGANTYIGNAPNFMVRSIAEEAGVSMPSFFGYILKWSLPILVPLFVLLTLLFF